MNAIRKGTEVIINRTHLTGVVKSRSIVEETDADRYLVAFKDHDGVEQERHFDAHEITPKV